MSSRPVRLSLLSALTFSLISGTALAVPPLPPPVTQKSEKARANASMVLYSVRDAYCRHGLSRPEALERLERLLGDDRSSPLAIEVLPIIDMLREMIREDEDAARPTRPTKSAAEARQETIRLLIFALRDQSDRIAWPNDETADEANPRAHLVEMGLDAVPQLIAAMDDDRWTRRTVNLGFRFDHQNVGECCRGILEEISGLHLGHRFRDPDARKRIEQWHRDIRTLREDDFLRKCLREPDGFPSRKVQELAERFVREHREEALELFPTLVVANPSHKMSYLHSLDAVDDERVPAMWRKELKAADLNTRVLAGRWLAGRGRPEGLTALLHEWKALKDDWGCAGSRNLISWFVRNPSKETIDALRTGFPVKSRSIRFEVLGALADRERNEDVTRVSSPEIEDAIDALLLAALDDTSSFSGMMWTRIGDNSVTVNRVCDLAGWVLAHRRGTPVDLNLEVDVETRDRQVRELKSANQLKR